MTRCARGRGRESPKKAVKRRREREGGEREIELARVSHSISELSHRIRLPPLPSSTLPFVTSSSGKPVASPPVLTPRDFFLGKFALFCSGLPRETKFPRQFSTRGVPRGYSRKSRPLPRNVHFPGFRKPYVFAVDESLNRVAIEFSSGQNIKGPG